VVADYAERLKAALERAGISARRLASLLAARTGNKADSERRSITKYQSGEERPDQERAALLAELLSAPELAEVPPVQARRQHRLRGLAEAVSRLELVVEELTARVEVLERQADDGSARQGQRR